MVEKNSSGRGRAVDEVDVVAERQMTTDRVTGKEASWQPVGWLTGPLVHVFAWNTREADRDRDVQDVVMPLAFSSRLQPVAAPGGIMLTARSLLVGNPSCFCSDVMRAEEDSDRTHLATLPPAPRPPTTMVHLRIPTCPVPRICREEASGSARVTSSGNALQTNLRLPMRSQVLQSLQTHGP